MIREDKFRISYRPYAVDLNSLRIVTKEPDPQQHRQRRIHAVRVDAVWFRRRSGATVAVLGSLWDYVRDPKPADVFEALARIRTKGYGGRWVARWDGDSYASEEPQEPDEQARHLAVLRPMLDGYPAVPAGYSGWWRFETRAEREGQR